MRSTAALMTLMVLTVFSAHPATVDGSCTEVAAEIRLRDYLRASIYPPENRLLDATDLPLENVPTIPGDAQKALTILAFSGERLERGHLYIAFRVKVQTAGTYSFRTYLADARGAPRVQSFITRDLRAGEATLQFPFYGKILRDGTGEGRYQLTGIAGEKLPAADGTQGRLMFFKAVYATKPYALKQWSDKPWDAPEKRAKIGELERQIAAERKKTNSCIK